MRFAKKGEVKDMGDVWRDAMADSFNRFLAKVITFLPNLLAMITILLIGFFIAWIVKIVMLRFLKTIQFDKVSERWGVPQVISKGGVAHTPSHLVSRFFYWVIVLITLILGINALEVAATQNFITHFFNYLPNLFAAILILVVGYLIAVFLGQATLIAAVNAQMDAARPLSRTVRWFVMVLSVTMALYHLGIAEKIIIAAFIITFGGIALALALAFGWGGRELAKEFLEKIYRRKGAGEGGDHLSHL
jgi:small-conductance mechanosensitive channel